MTAQTTILTLVEDLETGDLVDLQEDFYAQNFGETEEVDYWEVDAVSFLDDDYTVEITLFSPDEVYITVQFPLNHEMRVVKD